MKKRAVRYMACVLCLVLIAIMLSPLSTAADTISDEKGCKNTYMDVEEEVLEEDMAPRISLFSAEPEGLAKADLPSSYRSDQVSVNGTAVSYLPDSFRNQNPYGSCWAFSALGACEASLIRKGLAEGDIDLSERHLAYYFYNKPTRHSKRKGF